jgi:hypothetical protein
LPRSGKNFKKRPKMPKKIAHSYEVEVNFEVYDGAAKNERHKVTEPNQALQRTNMLVTDRAPSSTLRAKHVRR